MLRFLFCAHQTTTPPRVEVGGWTESGDDVGTSHIDIVFPYFHWLQEWNRTAAASQPAARSRWWRSIFRPFSLLHGERIAIRCVLLVRSWFRNQYTALNESTERFSIDAFPPYTFTDAFDLTAVWKFECACVRATSNKRTCVLLNICDDVSFSPHLERCVICSYCCCY